MKGQGTRGQGPGTRDKGHGAAPRRWPWFAAGLLAVLAAILLLTRDTSTTDAAAPTLAAAASTVTWFDYDIIRTYPHDPEAFTQGLVYRDGFLYESTGLEQASTLRKVEIETGRVVQQAAVAREHFAEGLADIGDRLVQLTWQSHVGLVYDLKSFALLRTFPYDGEGWGLVHDGTRLIMSDGTSALRFLAPDTFKETGRLTVTEDGRPLSDLNELEMVKGQLFANIWMTDQLAIINPATGVVSGRVNLRGLLAPADLQRRVDVLNGIAYDAAGDRLFVTGKWWPKLFEIRLKARR